jgi:hypothetical protein
MVNMLRRWSGKPGNESAHLVKPHHRKTYLAATSACPADGFTLNLVNE